MSAKYDTARRQILDALDIYFLAREHLEKETDRAVQMIIEACNRPDATKTDSEMSTLVIDLISDQKELSDRLADALFDNHPKYFYQPYYGDDDD